MISAQLSNIPNGEMPVWSKHAHVDLSEPGRADRPDLGQEKRAA